jgi:predicted dehydrogenase
MHGRGIGSNPGAKLIGIYDRQRAKAEAMVKKFGGRAFRSLEETLSDDKVKAIHVLTPPEQHVRLAVASLKTGKHVIVEKPVAWRVSEIDQLQALAKKVNRVCMPAHNYIYNPSLERAKRLIDTGKLGTIANVWILYNMFHAEEVAALYGGVIRAVCVHHAYSLLYLLGRPTRVMSAVSRVHYKKLTCEDQVAIVCQYPSGVIANLWCSFAANDPTADPWTVLYKILGTRGGLVYSWNEAQIEDTRGPGWGLPCYEESFRNEIDHFISRCILRNEQPRSTLHDARDALRIIEAVERSARSHKAEKVQYG